MLSITVTGREWYDEKRQEFVEAKTTTLNLEHSLVSISKWEAKWCKPFLNAKDLTSEELLDYIKCMTINSNVDDLVYDALSARSIQQIVDYIRAPMTATTFHTYGPEKHTREILTSELIYYWMVAYRIPFECQKWHINRLMTLIRICSIKNDPKKHKMSKVEAAQQYKDLNAQRRAKLNSKG